MAKAVVNKQQAEALAKLTAEFGHVSIEYDYGAKLIVSYGDVARATVYSTGKVEVTP